MTTLREAQEQGKLDQFIKERESFTGDGAAMDKAISSMAGKREHKPVEKPAAN